MPNQKFILVFVCLTFLFAGCLPPRSTPAPPQPTNTAAPVQQVTASLPPTKTLPVPTETIVPTAIPTRAATGDILAQLGGYPCPDSDFTCIKLNVPLDQLGNTTGETIEVTFAVLPASGERLGMFVTVVGGPGGSGLASADSYTDAFDPSLTEHFDIVFFDQRGVAASGGLQCTQAATAFYRADWHTDTPEHEAAFLEIARTFAQDCVDEMGIAVDRLPYYATSQAIEDLEIFRQAMGDEQFWLYGESYGTQYAQTYAAAYPEHLAGLILDGTVDLTQTGPEFYVEQAQAFSDTLAGTLKACSADEACAAEFDGDPLAFYEDLGAEITTAPAVVRFPLPSGEIAERPFTFSDLEFVASSEIYSEGPRLMFLRALAAAYRGDLVSLTRLLYGDLLLDPETLEPIPDPTYSDAVYYAVECADYGYYSGTPQERGQALLRDGDQVEADVPYLESIFYGDAPCIFWPAQAEAGRPEALVASGIPTLVLGATADPATPVQQGERVFSRLADGYLITTQGGAHVIFGRGDACPDEIVTDFLVDGTRPEERQMTCEGMMYDEYVPLAPTDAREFGNALQAMISLDNEFYYLPEYYYWDYETPTAVGCPYGGRLSFEITDTGEAYTLEGCAFTMGFVVTGRGTYDDETSLLTLEVDVSGRAEGHLNFTRDDYDGTYHVTGEYGGQVVDLSE